MIRAGLTFIFVILAGCAQHPTATYTPKDLSKYTPDCRYAGQQIDFLSKEISDYEQYHRTVPVTLEDQRYYGKLKNSIWALRSCGQRS